MVEKLDHVCETLNKTSGICLEYVMLENNGRKMLLWILLLAVMIPEDEGNQVFKWFHK
jgi:hypothetical protein